MPPHLPTQLVADQYKVNRHCLKPVPYVFTSLSKLKTADPIKLCA